MLRLSDFTKTLIWSLRFFFYKFQNIKFHRNPSNGVRVVPCEMT